MAFSSDWQTSSILNGRSVYLAAVFFWAAQRRLAASASPFLVSPTVNALIASEATPLALNRDVRGVAGFSSRWGG